MWSSRLLLLIAYYIFFVQWLIRLTRNQFINAFIVWFKKMSYLHFSSSCNRNSIDLFAISNFSFHYVHSVFRIQLYFIVIITIYSHVKLNNVNALDLQMTNINNDKHVSIVKCFFNESISYPIVSSSIIFVALLIVKKVHLHRNIGKTVSHNYNDISTKAKVM